MVKVFPSKTADAIKLLNDKTDNPDNASPSTSVTEYPEISIIVGEDP